MIMFGKLFAALIWAYWLLASGSVAHGQQELGNVSVDYNPSYSTTYDRVVKRGYLICGTNDEFPGFSQEVMMSGGEERWEGFDVDLCRAVAAAIFGDEKAVEFEIVNGKTRFTFLIDGTIDLLSAATTYTYTRNVLKKLEFMPTTFYDGQGFIVRKTLGVSSAKQMEGARICFSSSGTAAKNIKDFFKKHFINYIPVPVPSNEKTRNVYKRGDCDMYGTDRSGLASNRLGFDHPERHLILPEIISKEPLGPLVRHGDHQWGDVVRWSLNTLIIAEELGVSSANVDASKGSNIPEVLRLLGVEGGYGEMLELSNDFAYNIIKQVGNYSESFDRNIGPDTPLGIGRNLNALWTDGGILYAPPFR